MKFLVSLITPFDSTGRVDLGRLRAHVLWLSAQGVDGFLVTGVDGEFLYLSDREREAILRTVVDATHGATVRCFVWDPSPRTMFYLADAAVEQGVEGLVLPPPLFYDFSQDQVIAWYRRFHDRIDTPLYAGISKRWGDNGLRDEAYLALREEGVLSGMHNGLLDPWRVTRLAGRDPGGVCVSGDKLLYHARGVDGLYGVVSLLANAWPQMTQRAFREGDPDVEHALMARVAAVESAGGLRAVKAALKMRGRDPLLLPGPEALMDLPASEYDL
ncbi:MAG: dihydrodipicolinate synthase family protein [Deltaproteobacteria bacterium]|nr:dihydrodipicolinate synthase family protein [Deltaproteobacteria bacterium]